MLVERTADPSASLGMTKGTGRFHGALLENVFFITLGGRAAQFYLMLEGPAVNLSGSRAQ